MTRPPVTPRALAATRHACSFERADGGLRFVKRSSDRERRRSLVREAVIQRRLQAGDPRAAELTPRLLVRGSGSLTFEAIDADDLQAIHDGGGVDGSIAAAVGRAVACLHEHGPRDPSVPPAAVSTAVRAHRPDPSFLRELSGAGIDLVRLVQRSPELCGHLHRVEPARQECLVHGDLRWQNVLVAPRGGGASRVWLVDFECAGLGDPRLDVAAFIGGSLAAWLDSIPIVASVPAHVLVQRAAWPAGRAIEAIAAFLRAYLIERRIAGPDAQAFLEGACAVAAARLVHLAFEGTSDLEDVTLHSVLKVQVALNMFRDPARALGELASGSPAAAPGPR